MVVLYSSRAKTRQGISNYCLHHHVYELVLKTVFETKFSQVTEEVQRKLEKRESQYDTKINGKIVNLFNNFWNRSNKNCQRCLSRVDRTFNYIFKLRSRSEIKSQASGCNAPSPIDGEFNLVLKKKCLLSSQSKLTSKDKTSLLNVCIFIVTCFFKPWLVL